MFIEDLTSKGTTVEYTKIVQGRVKVISEYEANNNKTKDIYFVCGVDPSIKHEGGERTKDKDILRKKYFCIDMDIRKFIQSEGLTCTDSEIIEEGLQAVDFLKSDNKLFSERSYLVFTGNGLHLYYIGDDIEISVEEYSHGVEVILRMWDEYWGYSSFNSDHACKNIARILRLPGTVNQKNGSKCKIIAEQKSKSKLVGMIKQLGIEEIERQRLLDIERQKDLKDRLQFSDDQNNLYETINSIPAYQIAEILIPEFPFDGRKNFKNKKGGLTGYFYNAETNTICNGGSRYFNNGDTSSCWNNFSLVKMHYGYSNKDTFKFFNSILKYKK